MGVHVGVWVCTRACAEGEEGAGPGRERGDLKGSNFSPPRSVWFSAAPAASLLRAGGG